MHPKISIITVVFNGADKIEPCIKSVLNQSYENIEYIIIDGESTDKTLEIINRYIDKIALLISERDYGIYDAMNKGVQKATGDWIYFLGSDDKLIDDKIISSIFEDINCDYHEYMLLFGDVKYDRDRYFKSTFNSKILFKNTIHHQAAFYNKKLFLDFLYDTKFTIYADYELNLILFVSNVKAFGVNKPVAICSSNGRSDTPILLNYLQEINIRHKYLLIYHCLFFDFLTVLRFAIKKCLHIYKKLDYLSGF
jgi:putative colanic acid biosynthesis glycosyltransferase